MCGDSEQLNCAFGAPSPVMYNLPEISEPVAKLERLVQKEKDAQIQRRFHMLLLLKTGEAKSRSTAARHLGVLRNTIADWLELYEDGAFRRSRRSRTPDRSPVSSRFLPT